MQIMLIVGILFLAGCTTPSTMMINREGKVTRCSAYGYGNAMAIGVADQIHDTCVRDARSIGFVPLPRVSLGFFAETKKPMRVLELDGANAQSAGLRVGDVILELDSKPVENFFTIVTVMNTKKIGDRVSLKVQREQEILPLTIVVAAGR